MSDRLFGKNIEVLYGVIQDDTCHSDASQGISHIDSGVGEFASFIHNYLYRADCLLQFYLYDAAKIRIVTEYSKFAV